DQGSCTSRRRDMDTSHEIAQNHANTPRRPLGLAPRSDALVQAVAPSRDLEDPHRERPVATEPERAARDGDCAGQLIQRARLPLEEAERDREIPAHVPRLRARNPGWLVAEPEMLADDRRERRRDSLAVDGLPRGRGRCASTGRSCNFTARRSLGSFSSRYIFPFYFYFYFRRERLRLISRRLPESFRKLSGRWVKPFWHWHFRRLTIHPEPHLFLAESRHVQIWHTGHLVEHREAM